MLEDMLTGDDLTLGEWITGPSGRTGAHRVVIDDLALRVEAAGAETRVLAFGVDTGVHRCALGASHALGPAFGWYTEVTRETRANRNVAHTAALTVGAAR